MFAKCLQSHLKNRLDNIHRSARNFLLSSFISFSSLLAKNKRPVSNCFETSLVFTIPAVPLKLRGKSRTSFRLQQALCTHAAYAEAPTHSALGRFSSEGMGYFETSLPGFHRPRLSVWPCFKSVFVIAFPIQFCFLFQIEVLNLQESFVYFKIFKPISWSKRPAECRSRLIQRFPNLIFWKTGCRGGAAEMPRSTALPHLHTRRVGKRLKKKSIILFDHTNRICIDITEHILYPVRDLVAPDVLHWRILPHWPFVSLNPVRSLVINDMERLFQLSAQ